MQCTITVHCSSKLQVAIYQARAVGITNQCRWRESVRKFRCRWRVPVEPHRHPQELPGGRQNCRRHVVDELSVEAACPSEPLGASVLDTGPEASAVASSTLTGVVVVAVSVLLAICTDEPLGASSTTAPNPERRRLLSYCRGIWLCPSGNTGKLT
jgi:hypothetical protein